MKKELGFLYGQVTIHCKETPGNSVPEPSRIDIVKDISKKIQNSESLSALPRPDKNVSKVDSPNSKQQLMSLFHK